MHLYENNKIVDAECGIDHFNGLPCIVIESSGGANKNLGIKRRNPDYNNLLSLILKRLAKINIEITNILLDSRKVAKFHTKDKIANLSIPYPINLNSVNTEEFRKMLQYEVSQMHRDQNSKQGGNTQKKIKICLNRFIDFDIFIYGEELKKNNNNEIFNSNITKTESAYLLNSRIGQGEFRKNLIDKYGGRCQITGIEQEQLLIASHIKPWQVCTNVERLDSNNGIL